ncbi:MAG: hypothetical protein V4501_09080 [Pseudomonadota bacterium]
MKVLVNSTPVALWQTIIHDAEIDCATTLPQELEAYVVMLMMRYMDKPELAREVIATQLLEGLNQRASAREARLQKVGDICLLFSGLFPGMAEKRLVKISYFINLGRGAYATMSRTSNDIFGLLAQQFVAIMDILQSAGQHAQQYPQLMPLQAYELWNECGSQRALRALKQYTQATPISLNNHQGCIIKLK